MVNMSSSMQFSFVIFLFLSYQFAFSHLCSKHDVVSLLNFKKSFTIDPEVYMCSYGQKSKPKTSSWNMSIDCCSWDGVTCDEMTGHVIGLDLSCSQLVGVIDSNSSLFQLSHLQRLNLSYNNFSNSHISPEFSRFSSLTYLDLSGSYFSGQIPSEIYHLSKLQSLFFSSNSLRFDPHDFELLLQNLTQLRELDLSGVNISSTIPLNFSSHLTTLVLERAGLYGTIPETIFQLPNLEILDLRENDQLSVYLPKTKWNSSASLVKLDLTGMNFSGNLHESLGYLTSLHSLFLRNCNLRGPIPESLSNLTHLKYLDLGDNSLNGTIPSWIFSLPSLSLLTSLNLHGNKLEGKIPSSVCNLTSLVILDLAKNNLKGVIPQCLDNINSLEVLDMHHNSLTGTLPMTFRTGSSLRSLNLHGNKLEGKIPRSLANCTKLQVVDLGDNQLNDTFPMWLGTLPNLQVLSLRYNKLHGSIQPSRTESMFPELQIIDLSCNAFSGNLPTSLFQHLKAMRTIDPSQKAPRNIYFQESVGLVTKGFEHEVVRILFLYTVIDLSNNKFEGPIPSVLGELTALRELNLSHNGLQGHIPSSLGSLSLVESLDLSGNHLVGEIPAEFASLTSLVILNLRSNLLQGSLPIPPDSTALLFISQNNLSGQIPSSICNLNSLAMLDLGNNSLNGEIPQCLGNIRGLEVLDMRHNNLSGVLPTTFRIGSSLTSLNLHGNKLEGKIPRSLANCTSLQVLDLGDNQLNDTFPMWLGTLSNLQVLSLRYNKLHGSVQPSRTKSMFPELRIIDLSCNAFSGNLPTTLFQHLKAMKISDPSKKAPEVDGYYQDSVAVVTKGLEREIVRILFLYTAIDLSNNKFEGPIPSVMGELTALRVLNLSHDGLEGNIPPSLGSLSSIESLDLSVNHLVGEIPAEFASLTSLEVLNLSYNHLEGCIPQGNQFHTFDNNSYEGNDGLRGFPVSKGCGSSGMPETNNARHVQDEESNSTFLSEFRQGIPMGYGTGLIIGFCIAYFMLSSRNPNWLSRITQELEYRIVMRRRKKQRRHQRHYRR